MQVKRRSYCRDDNERHNRLGVGNWTLELIGNIWLFGENDDFLGDSSLHQDPLYVIKTHAVYSFRPGFWIGAGLGYGKGAHTEVNGVTRNTSQENWRFGFSLAYPLNRQNGISFALGSGANNGAGADFNTIALSYQYAWGGLSDRKH